MQRGVRRVLTLTVLLAACNAPWSRQPTPAPVPTATAVPATAPRVARSPTGVPTAGGRGTASPPAATLPVFTATRTPPTPARASPVATATRATPPGTPRASATASPAATRTVGPDYAIRDAAGLCQMTLPGQFRDDGGIWRVGDEAGVTLVGTPTGGFLDFDTATQLLVGNIGTQIGDYRETGRTREGADRLRITYTGQVFGVPGGGIIYQQQFGQTICGLVLFAAAGERARYAAPFERIIASFAAAR